MTNERGRTGRGTLSDVGDARSSHSFYKSRLHLATYPGENFPRAVGGMILVVFVGINLSNMRIHQMDRVRQQARA